MKIDKYYLLRNSKYILGEIFITASGKGKCVKIEETKISIDFGETTGIKKYAFPEPLIDGRIQWFDRDEAIKRIDEKRKADGVPIHDYSVILEMDYLEKICWTIKCRGIKHFVHYTRVDNITSILKYGLCSVQYMAEHNIPFIANDEQRLDGRRDSISLSVSFPNYKNFYLARERGQTEWCVIHFDPIKVIELDCAFFRTNAANSIFRDIDWNELKVPESFEKMFESRNRSNEIPDCYTTDPQAEIMVRDFIPVEFIEQISFNYPSNVDYTSIPCKCKCNPLLFSYRDDYLKWQHNNQDMMFFE